MPSAARLLFGAVARCTTAWARLSCASGSPTCSTAPGGGDGHEQRLRVGHAHVLAGQDDQAAGDEAGVLPRLQHAGQPVQPGVGVRAADRLDEGGDHVVVVVAAVAQGATRRARRSRRRPSTTAGRPRRSIGQRDRHLERGEHLAAVAAGAVDQLVERVGVGGGPLGLQPPLGQRARARPGSSGSSRNSVDRLRSGGLTSKNGFSVVAPISVSRPSSTLGSRASCCALLKRWISSRKRIVPLLRARPRRCAGALDHLAHVLDRRR